MSCLIVFHSLTHAQTANAVLQRGGLSAALVKPPVSLGRGSCAHGLVISDRSLPAALGLLQKTSRKPLGVYTQQKGTWQEVSP